MFEMGRQSFAELLALLPCDRSAGNHLESDTCICDSFVPYNDRHIQILFLYFFCFSVTNVSQKEKARTRPQALNTVELLKVASSALGMGPQHAMQIAEKLYTQVH